MAIEPTNELPRANTNRKVWVLNRHYMDHVEVFRGDEIVVPKDNEKGLLMPYLAAERFLGQMWPVYDTLPDGKYRKGEAPKALWIQELTDEERKSVEGVSPEQAKINLAEQESDLRLTCQSCGFKAVSEHGLKIHNGKNHGEQTNEQPVMQVTKGYDVEGFSKEIRDTMK